jgi:outer membrane protein assembly factor BamA
MRVARPLSLGLAAESALNRFCQGDPRAGDPAIGNVYCVRILRHCLVGTVDPRQVPGFNEGTQFIRGTATAALDTRDRWFAPSTGFLARALADYTHGLGFDDSSYFRLSGTVALAMSVWQHGHTFVLWIYADASLFVDYGGSFAQNFRDIQVQRLYWDLGGALRFATRSQFYFSLGIAYGLSGGGLQLVLSGGGP